MCSLTTRWLSRSVVVVRAVDVVRDAVEHGDMHVQGDRKLPREAAVLNVFSIECVLWRMCSLKRVLRVNKA
jgi:hypothetical protein